MLGQPAKQIDLTLKSDAIITIGTRVMSLILQGAWAILIARFLGPEGRGELGLLLTVPMLAALVFDFGIGTSNTYFVAHEKTNLEKIVANSLWMTLVLGGALCLCLWNVATYITATFLNNANQFYFRIAVMGIPFILGFKYFIGILQGQRRFLIYNASQLLTFISLITLFLFFHGIFKFGVLDAILAWVIAWLITLSFAVFHVIKKKRPKPSFHFEILTKTLRFSYKIFVSEIVNLLNYRLTLLIVGYFCSLKILQSKDPGYFVISITFGEALLAVASSVQVVILPRIVQSSEERIADLVPRAVRNVLFLNCVCILVLRIIDPVLIPFLFGHDYLPAIKPLHIIYIGILVAGSSKILGTYFLGAGKPEINAYCNFVGLVFNVLACWLLIPVFGLAGAAWSVAIGNLVVALLQIVNYLKRSNVGLKRLMLLNGADLSFYLTLVKKHVLRVPS